MKTIKFATLGLAVLFYATNSLSQHAHTSANGMGHQNGFADHSNTAASRPESAHGKTVDQILAKNTKLAGRISKLTGEPASTACAGFRNLGQCVAAAHVSKNLGISFDCLKDDMTGTAPAKGSSCPAGTGAKSMSLGKAIKTLDPAVDQKAASRKAETEAAKDLTGSDS